MARTFKKNAKEDKFRKVKTESKKDKGSFKRKAQSGILDDEYDEE